MANLFVFSPSRERALPVVALAARMCGPSSALARKNARSYAVSGVLCLIAALLAAVLPGCAGSDRSKAQDYLKAGAEQIQQIRDQASDWQNKLIPTSGATDPKVLKESARAVGLSAIKMSNEIDKAKVTYGNVVRLKGVNDYVKYADLRLAQLDMIKNMLDKTNKYLQEKVTVASSGDLSDLTTLEQRYSDEMSNIANQVENIDAQAAKMKKEKEL